MNQKTNHYEEPLCSAVEFEVGGGNPNHFRLEFGKLYP